MMGDDGHLSDRTGPISQSGSLTFLFGPATLVEQMAPFVNRTWQEQIKNLMPLGFHPVSFYPDRDHKYDTNHRE